MSESTASSTTCPDFDDLAAVFWRLGSMLSPSQLHGYLMGQLAVGALMPADIWLPAAWQLIDGVEAAKPEDDEVLLRLLLASRESLAEAEADNPLLLPDDEVEFDQRVECLGHWCRGFLAGFAAGGKDRKASQGQQQYTAEVSEALSDIAAISQISLDDSEEQSEGDFFEVAEYVRLATLTIYLDCQPQPDSQKLSSQSTGPATGPATPKDKLSEAVGSVSNLFGAGGKKTLH